MEGRRVTGKIVCALVLALFIGVESNLPLQKCCLSFATRER